MRQFFSAAVWLAGSVSVVAAQDWPQWRGPSADATVAAPGVPAAWPAAYARVWRVEVGEGYASPVVAGGRVFVHSRTDPDEVVTALDLAAGRVVWQQRYPASFSKNQYAVRMAKGPNATPLLAAGRLFTMGVTGILVAWDAATGKEIWRKDYSAQVDTSKLFCGTAASPLLSGGLLVVQVGSDVRGGQILALDPATGAERWTWRGPGPGYASPVVMTIGGTRQIVTMTNQSVIGLDAATGGALWTTPFPDDWHENIVTPVWTGSAIVVSGPRQGTRAFRVERAGGQWRVTESWRNPAVTMYMSTPVVGDGLLYGLSSKQKGQFVALDVATGAVVWTTTGREAEHASVLLAPRHVIYLTNGGDLVVAGRGPAGFALEKKYDVADAETWAMPVLLGRDLLVRDATGVARLAGK
jgi:outer membrane protein assembly factor BamB